MASVEAVYLGRELAGPVPEGAAVRLFAESTFAGLRYILGRSSSALVRACRSLDLDVLHSHFGVEGMCSSKAARKMGIPAVTTLHGFDVTHGRRFLASSGSPSWARYALERSRFLREAEALICVSDFVRAQAVRWGARPDRCHVVPTGVDTRRLVASPLPARPVIVYVGRLVEVKGTEFLVRAVAELSRRVPAVELRLVGDGPLRPSLESLVDSLGIRGHVSFLGVASHDVTLAQIEQARVLCLPSVRTGSGATEGLGQVLLEASALGRPVVASRSGGIPEAVQDRQTGLLVPERDVSALRDALHEILTDDMLATAMGMAGRRRTEEIFDLHVNARRVAAVYESMR
jgi:glycosyltransferase involved in cell wall biosynthesis